MEPPSTVHIPQPYRILLVDDDALLLTTLRGRLEAEGYAVEVCDNGEEGLQRTLSWSPHVVILDHYMPYMNGRDVCARLRALKVETRVVLLTTAQQVPDRVAGLDAGADDYILKPFEVDELLARIRAQLRSAPAAVIAEEVARAMVEGLLSADPAVKADALERIQKTGGGLDFRALGSFRMYWHGVELSSLLWNRRKPRSLLKRLLLHQGQTIVTDVLMETFWPDVDAEVARRNLHVTIQRLRGALEPFGAERVETGDGGYGFRLLAEDRFDLHEFERLAAEIGAHLHDGGVARSLIPRLLELYGGELFAEEAYTDWVVGPRDRLRTLLEDRVGAVALAQRGRGDLQSASALLRRLLELDPSNEIRAVDLAECLVEMRDFSGARDVLQRTDRILRDELALTPGRRFLALLDSLRQ